MKFLLFLLWVSYFFIFFLLFGRGVDSDNLSLFWQWQIYVFIVVVCILYTLEMKSFQSKKRYFPEISVKTSISSTKNFIKDNLYFIGILFLYTSFYFILRGLFEDIHINIIFLIVNLWTIIAYFLWQKSNTVYNIIQWNTIIISLFYSLTHLAFLFWVEVFFTFVDIGNLILISILFILLFISDRPKNTLYYTAIHALIFYILEISILFYFIIPAEFLVFSIILLFSFLTHIFFYFPDELSFITRIPQVFFLRYWNILSISLIILYIFSLFYFTSLIWFSWLVVLLHSAYLFLYYKNFTFFPSLIFFILWVISTSIWFFLYFFWWFFLQENISFILLLFSTWVFIFSYTKKHITLTHLYSLHFIFLWINLIWCVLFLVFRDFSVLSFWYLLFFEAIYFIANSYLFKKLY